MRSAWHQYDYSFIPLLDRALGEVIRYWSAMVRQRQPDPFSADLDSNPAGSYLKSIFQDIRQEKEQNKRKIGPAGMNLYVRPQALEEMPWNEGGYSDKVGKYLRNALQDLIKSPTIVPKLQAAHEVAILGVGASVHADLPTTEGLFDEIKDTLKTSSPDTFSGLENSDFTWAWNGRDIEDLLSALQARIWACNAFQSPVPQEEVWINDILFDYRQVIVQHLQAWRTKNGNDDLTRRLLEAMQTCSKDHCATGEPPRQAIITFNQDTVVELEAKQLGWPWESGYGFIVADSGLDVYSDSPPMRIYKPHGSISWYRQYATNPELGACKVLTELLDPSSIDTVAPQKKFNIPVILVPSFFKLYEDRIIWNSMARMCCELHEARHIRVIGFRLRNDDTIVSHLIRLSLRNNMEAERGSECIIELIGPSADSDAEGSMGKAWASVLAALAAKGWSVSKRPLAFSTYAAEL